MFNARASFQVQSIRSRQLTTLHSKEMIDLGSKKGDIWLKLAVHLHALRRTPRAYLTALWWRVCGKRLRARAQFAPLLATSSHAYKLWLCNEPRLVADQEDNTFPRILALVSAGQTSGALESTLRSLAQEGLTAIVVGTPKLPSPPLQSMKLTGRKPLVYALAAGDILAPGAAQAYRRKIRESQARVIYADDDLLDEAGQRMKVHLKPDWNRELFQYLDYVTGACVISVTAQDLKNASPLEWPRELVDAALRSKEEPEHIHHVLHHRRSRPYPRPLPSPSIAGPLPPVSVIVPTRNRLDLLRTCLDGVASTDYPDIEVIVVDNGSDDPATLAYLDGLAPDRYRVLRHPGPFNFSALNNHAANQAKGHLLCLLNNDIEVLSLIGSRRWLRKPCARMSALLGHDFCTPMVASSMLGSCLASGEERHTPIASCNPTRKAISIGMPFPNSYQQ
jgi:hypothetical protein